MLSIFTRYRDLCGALVAVVVVVVSSLLGLVVVPRLDAHNAWCRTQGESNVLAWERFMRLDGAEHACGPVACENTFACTVRAADGRSYGVLCRPEGDEPSAGLCSLVAETDQSRTQRPPGDFK